MLLLLKLSLFPKCGLAGIMCIFNTLKGVWKEEVKIGLKASVVYRLIYKDG